MDELSEQDLEAAEQNGRAILASEPRAVAARFDLPTRRVIIELANECSYVFPVRLVQDLQGAADTQLEHIEVDGSGLNLHWPMLDVDLYVPAIVANVFGTRNWMLSARARNAGRAVSAAKTRAARANGAKGGRPRKQA